MNKILILHNTEDLLTAQLLGESLKSKKMEVLFDHSVVYGLPASIETNIALTSAKAIIVLLSKNSKSNRLVDEKIASILEKGHMVVPVLLDPEAKENWIWPLLSERRSFQFKTKSDADGIAEYIQLAIKEPLLSEGLISNQLVEITISDLALTVSRERKLQKIFGHPDALETLLLSTPQEMEEDWRVACAQFAVNVLKRIILFSQLSSNSNVYLEETWLRKIKEVLAYFYWRGGSTKGDYKDFMDAGAEVRSWLLDRDRCALREFDAVKSYLMDRYLAGENKLNEESSFTHSLIEKKARRIWERTGEQNEQRNWFRAKLYVKLFYENIIGAVLYSDEKKTAKILEAFEFSKSPENNFIIINAFEAVVAIEFLDKEVLNRLKDTQAYDLNMVSFEDLPLSPKRLEEIDKALIYDKDSGQLRYLGKMSIATKNMLLDEIKKEGNKIEPLTVAIEHLYNQSQQKPFKDQIL